MMNISFFSGSDIIRGASALAFRFEIFAFIASAFESHIYFIRFIATLLSITTLIMRIVESFLDCPVFVAASKEVWIRQPRKPPDKSCFLIQRRVRFPVDCWVCYSISASIKNRYPLHPIQRESIRGVHRSTDFETINHTPKALTGSMRWASSLQQHAQ